MTIKIERQNPQNPQNPQSLADSSSSLTLAELAELVGELAKELRSRRVVQEECCKGCGGPLSRHLPNGYCKDVDYAGGQSWWDEFGTGIGESDLDLQARLAAAKLRAKNPRRARDLMAAGALHLSEAESLLSEANRQQKEAQR